ncbi:hypothetical protein LOTGIDRAFT_206060 [Lottia gigantea]|uniref:Glutaminyl-peptide cyclotransferase n=1 Tax=Lottia gigantea TaxID=225164 RepID=V4CKZ3_LOTGI|nr:hypothetical protein LOTGIDRAFT_206060 [Lottia gigantea]ESP02920.1 hypothetical protein LOTGIDRAFT_206060 [Lottia gigantea]
MPGMKWFWTFSVLLTCWILPFLHATVKKRSLPVFSRNILKIISEEYSNREQFREILTPLLVERVPDTPGNTQVQRFIEERMTNLGWTITKDRFVDTTPYGVKHFTNIIATYNPNSPNRLALVCHFDSKQENYKFVGATDSAVPCAMLIDLATNLECLLAKSSANANVPDTTIEMIFLDGEEAFQRWSDTDSIYGARHLAQKWKLTPDPHDPSKNMLQTITDFVLLDLIGTSDVQFKNMFKETNRLYQHLYKIENKLLKYNNLVKTNGQYRPYFMNEAPRSHGIQDDHIPFLHEGVNILHLISVPFPSVWHRETDDLQHLNFTAIDNFNRIFRVFVSSYLHLEADQNSCRRK